MVAVDGHAGGEDAAEGFEAGDADFDLAFDGEGFGVDDGDGVVVAVGNVDVVAVGEDAAGAGAAVDAVAEGFAGGDELEDAGCGGVGDVDDGDGVGLLGWRPVRLRRWGSRRRGTAVR